MALSYIDMLCIVLLGVLAFEFTPRPRRKTGTTAYALAVGIALVTAPLPSMRDSAVDTIDPPSRHTGAMEPGTLPLHTEGTATVGTVLPLLAGGIRPGADLPVSRLPSDVDGGGRLETTTREVAE